MRSDELDFRKETAFSILFIGTDFDTVTWHSIFPVISTVINSLMYAGIYFYHETQN